MFTYTMLDVVGVTLLVIAIIIFGIAWILNRFTGK